MLRRHRTVTSLLYALDYPLLFSGWDIPGRTAVVHRNPGPVTSFWTALGGRHA